MPGEIPLSPIQAKIQPPLIEMSLGAVQEGIATTQTSTDENHNPLDWARKQSVLLRAKRSEGTGWLVSFQREGGIGRRAEPGTGYNEPGYNSFLDALLRHDATIAASEWDTAEQGPLTNPDQLLGISTEDLKHDVLKILSGRIRISTKDDTQLEALTAFQDGRYGSSREYQTLLRIRNSELFKRDGQYIGEPDVYAVSMIGAGNIDRLLYLDHVVQACAGRLADVQSPATDRLAANLALRLALAEQNAHMATLTAVRDAISSRLPQVLSSDSSLRALFNNLFPNTTPVPGVEMPDRSRIDEMRSEFRQVKAYERPAKLVMPGVKDSHLRRANVLISGESDPRNFPLK